MPAPTFRTTPDFHSAADGKKLQGNDGKTYDLIVEADGNRVLCASDGSALHTYDVKARAWK